MSEFLLRMSIRTCRKAWSEQIKEARKCDVLNDVPVIAHIPTREVCSFGEYRAPPRQHRFSPQSLKCFQIFPKSTPLMTYMGGINIVKYGQNYVAISFVAFNDFFQLFKTPRRRRVVCGENNYTYPTSFYGS